MHGPAHSTTFKKILAIDPGKFNRIPPAFPVIKIDHRKGAEVAEAFV